MKIILVDSDALFALNSKNDVHFKEAYRISLFLTKQDCEFVISNFVLAEVTTLLNYRAGHQKAVSFFQEIRKSRFPIIRINEETESLGYRIFQEQKSKEASIVDCFNMAILKKNHWQTIFSFDQIYRKNGFQLAWA